MVENTNKVKFKWLNKWYWREIFKVEEHQFVWFLIRMGIAIVLLWVISFIIDKMGSLEFVKEIISKICEDPIPTLDTKDMLSTQISVSFMVISLTSILSSTTMPIYWTDKVELSLVKPIFFSLPAFGAYIFGGLVFCSISFFTESDYVAVGFWASIIIISCLTIKTLDLYFGSKKAKAEAEKFFEWMKDYNKEEYESAKQKMITVMSKNMAENDFATFFENFEFLYTHKEDEDIAQIIKMAKCYNLILFERILDKLLSKDRKNKILENGVVANCNIKDMAQEYPDIHKKIDDYKKRRIDNEF